MKKRYEKPEIELIILNQTDIITASSVAGGLTITTDDEPEQKWADWF